MAKVLRITAKRDGFRRAGIAHQAKAVDHPIDAFTDEQITALQAEPMLVVEEVEQAAAGKTAGKKNEGAGSA